MVTLIKNSTVLWFLLLARSRPDVPTAESNRRHITSSRAASYITNSGKGFGQTPAHKKEKLCGDAESLGWTAPYVREIGSSVWVNDEEEDYITVLIMSDNAVIWSILLSWMFCCSQVHIMLHKYLVIFCSMCFFFVSVFSQVCIFRVCQWGCCREELQTSRERCHQRGQTGNRLCRVKKQVSEKQGEDRIWFVLVFNKLDLVLWVWFVIGL